VAYGQTHTQTIPTVGSTLGPAYATMINSVLTEMRATLDAKVTPAGIDMNADLSLRSGATYYGLKDVHRLSLTTQASLLSASTYPGATYVGPTGDLYFNDASGNQIALTSAGTIAGSAGSISGSGYGSSGVEVNWDSGAGDYHFYSGSATYADIKAANVLLNDGDTNFIRLAAPALAADYTATWPSALPASTSLFAIASDGTMSFTRTPTVDTLALTGALSVGTTSTFSGKPTFSVEYAHPQRVKHVLAAECYAPSMTLTTSALNIHWDCTVTGQAVFIPISLTEGDRLESIIIWVTQTGAGTRTYELVYWNNTVGVWTSPGGAYDVTSASTAGRQAITLDITDITVQNPANSGTGAGFLGVWCTLVNNDQFWGARLLYSRQ
jgi:hypothetical protein